MWPWKRQREVKEEPTVGMEEARRAAEKSQQDVTRVDRLIKEVRPVMGQLHERREQNGFTALFEAAMQGKLRKEGGGR